MAPRYKITLTKKERKKLETMTRNGKIPAKKFLYARALLLSDAGEHGDPWKVADVAEALGVTNRTIEHLKQRFVEEGLEMALTRKPLFKPRDRTFGRCFLTPVLRRWLVRARLKGDPDGLCDCWQTRRSN